MSDLLTILTGDCRDTLITLPDASVQCCVTSPPYWGLRDYGHGDQIGLEPTPEAYVKTMVKVFREVKRVLRDDGTLWLNLGDSYARMQENNVPQSKNPQCTPPGANGRIKNAGLKPKDLVGIPWRVAFALQSDGWYLRSDIIWHKPNPMPESVTDRPTKSHEYIFLLTKQERYYYDQQAILEPAQFGEAHANKSTSWGPNGKMAKNGIGKSNRDDYLFCGDNHTSHKCVDGSYGRNKRSVWTVPTSPYSEAHFATFPPDLIKPCILAGTSARGCCPKCGAPWERDIERTANYDKRQDRSQPNGVPGQVDSSGWKPATIKDNGWQPTCQHGEDASEVRPVPCTVLDCFGGAGTVGQVSLELGRKAILIELNPAYVELAKQRCNITPGFQLA